MKKFLFLVICLGFIQEVRALEEKFRDYQAQFPQGNVESIPYVKNLLETMVHFDQSIRTDFLKERGSPERQNLLEK